MIYGKPSKLEIEMCWDILSKYKCKKILHAGCSVGWLGEHKPNESIRVYGIDINEKEIEIAKKHEIAIVGNVMDMPYKDNVFDIVYFANVLEHISNNIKAMREIYRVLKKEGILVIVAPLPHRAFWDDYSHIRPYTIKSLSNLVKDTGFEILSCRYTALGIPGFGKLGLYSLASKLGNFLANHLHIRKAGILMECKK